MSAWRLIDSGPADAFLNMALDEALALCAESPVMRFYGWSAPSVSIGSFQRAEELDLEYLASKRIPLVRRITGGRGILHGHELTYSFSAPASGLFSGGLRQTYVLLGSVFENALRELGLGPETSRSRRPSVSAKSPLCFGSASVGEIKIGGRKVVGSAQKRWPGRFIQQGSVPFTIDYETLSRVFGTGASETRTCMAGLSETEPSLELADLKSALSASFAEVLGVKLVVSDITSREEALAGKLRRKYASSEWNLSRRSALVASAP